MIMRGVSFSLEMNKMLTAQRYIGLRVSPPLAVLGGPDSREPVDPLQSALIRGAMVWNRLVTPPQR